MERNILTVIRMCQKFLEIHIIKIIMGDIDVSGRDGRIHRYSA